MSNLTSNIPSLDGILYDDYTYGSWRQPIFIRETTSISGGSNITGGFSSPLRRHSIQVTVPGVTSPVTGYVITQLDFLPLLGTNTSVCWAGAEFSLGSLTVSGNTFSPGVTMPTRTVRGLAVQTASVYPILAVTATLTATSPIVTITYTNQTGSLGKTVSVTLPTGATVGSAYPLITSLASGDSGIQAVTNISISTGSAGSLSVMGIIPLGGSVISSNGTASGVGMTPIEPLLSSMPLVKLIPNDTIGFYTVITAGGTAIDYYASLVGVPER